MAKSEIKMKMSLDSSGVKAGLMKAKSGIANFAKEANEKLGSVAKLAAGGLVAGFAAASRSALQYGKEVKTLAQVSNASMKEFQRMAAGAKTVGVEHDKLADIFKDMNDRVGDFVQTGGGPMSDFFEKIAPLVGVTADEFRNLSGPQALQLYYDSLEKANLSQEDMTFYMEAIASDSTMLIPLLADGGKAFKDLGDDAEAAGLVMSSSTADNLAKAQTTIDNFKQKATIKVGELISGEANFAALKALGARVGQMLATVGEAIINTLLGGVKTVASALAAGFTVAFENLKKGFKLVGLELAKAITPVFNSLADLLSNIGIDIQKWNIDNIQNEIDKIQFDSPNERFKELKKEYKGAWDEAIPEINGASKAFGELAETYERQAKTAGVAREAIKKQKEEAQKLAAAEAQATAKITDEYKLQQELKEAMIRGDDEAIALIKDELDLLQRVSKVKKEHGLNDEQALAHVERMIEKEKEQADAKKSQNAEKESAEERLKQLQLDQIRAQAAGNDDLALELQKRIDKEQEAIDLMDRFNLGLDEARQLAEKLAAVNAAPDGLDAFQIGGNIRNVSKDKRNRDLGAERAARAEKRLREAENREIGKRVRFGEDKADVMADINQRRAKRAGGGGGGGGGQPPNGGEPKVGGQPPNGPGGKGPDGKKGPDPKKPEDPAKTTNKKLDEQIGLLKDIKDALKC